MKSTCVIFWGTISYDQNVTKIELFLFKISLFKLSKKWCRISWDFSLDWAYVLWRHRSDFGGAILSRGDPSSLSPIGRGVRDPLSDDWKPVGERVNGFRARTHHRTHNYHNKSTLYCSKQSSRDNFSPISLWCGPFSTKSITTKDIIWLARR